MNRKILMFGPWEKVQDVKTSLGPSQTTYTVMDYHKTFNFQSNFRFGSIVLIPQMTEDLVCPSPGMEANKGLRRVTKDSGGMRQYKRGDLQRPGISLTRHGGE